MEFRNLTIKTERKKGRRGSVCFRISGDISETCIERGVKIQNLIRYH